jgi:2-polyprenyl-3-methyl-5-hydroxy-6-metoxy-1,4-benzoquinol methylase
MTHRRGRSLRQLVTDRLVKHGLYDQPHYWDMKAAQYEGLARSNWPSNAYNRELHAAQMRTVDSLLGEVAGLTIADMGCGTGRASLHLASRGARTVGFDFSRGALEAAREEARRAALAVRFELADVMATPAPEHRSQYDIVLSLGCLCLACADVTALDHALAHLTALLRPGGRLLLIEPMHSSRLLSRILRLSVPEWIGRCERQKLELLGRGGLLFVPTRYALAFRDLPRALVRPLFSMGERLLASTSWLQPLADYKWLLLSRPTLEPGTDEA